MTEAIRTTPTVCYLEVPGSMMPQRAAFERDRCRVQDLFDFLCTQPTPGEVFAFLEGWYS